MTTALAIALSLLVGAANGKGAGRVRFATATRAYVDVGSASGLVAGQTLTLGRKQRTLSSCRIDSLAEHSASCDTTLAASGDAVTFTLATAAPSARAETPLPPRPSAQSLALAEQALAEPQPRIASKPVASLDRSSRLIPATIAYTHMFSTRFDGRDFHEERFDLSLDGLSLGFAGFRAWASASLDIWSVRPQDARFRPRTPVQLYVWELAIASRELGRPFTAALGRIWPEHTPYLGVLDGAQAGWRSHDGSIEVGAVGGGVPEALSLAPSFQRWSAGAYVAHSYTGGHDATLRLFRDEVRVSAVNVPGLGLGVEAAARVQAMILRKLDIGASALTFYRADLGFTVSAASTQIVVRPVDEVHATLALNYLGQATDDTLIGVPTSRRLHSNLDVQWLALPWLHVGAFAGIVADIGSNRTREWFGPELVFPTALAGHGSIGIGYREEVGYWRGRNAYVTLATSSPRWHAFARFNFTQDYVLVDNTQEPMSEVSATLSAEIRATRWLGIIAAFQPRYDLVAITNPHTPPLGINASLGVVGYF